MASRVRKPCPEEDWGLVPGREPRSPLCEAGSCCPRGRQGPAQAGWKRQISEVSNQLWLLVTGSVMGPSIHPAFWSGRDTPHQPLLVKAPLIEPHFGSVPSGETGCPGTVGQRMCTVSRLSAIPPPQELQPSETMKEGSGRGELRPTACRGALLSKGEWGLFLLRLPNGPSRESCRRRSVCSTSYTDSSGMCSLQEILKSIVDVNYLVFFTPGTFWGCPVLWKWNFCLSLRSCLE